MENENRRAREARAQAERLVEFIVLDLRNQLDPLGRLDLLESADDAVAAYYKNPAAADSPGAKEQKIARLENQGDVFYAKRDFPAALSNYQTALTISSKPGGARPSKEEHWQWNLSAIWSSIGQLQSSTKAMQTQRAT